ncbi:MAG: hypothetical protein K8R77_04915 [Anaerolineaceae bacterium]|nr:hypothetical protein [Anaerolineaceae bacterium]
MIEDNVAMMILKKKMLILAGLWSLLVLTGCTAAEVMAVPESSLPATETLPTESAEPVVTQELLLTPTDLVMMEEEESTPSSPESTPTSPPQSWQDCPIVPETISDTTIEIYQRGLALGNHPNAFSKIGDCETHTTWFLYDFDQGSKAYNLGPYAELQSVVDHFEGSYERLSLATKQGFTAASLMTPLWANREKCENNESPLACELRTHQPSFAIVALGTNDASNPERFEENYRKVIETCIERGVVPILATKADDLEGDGVINATIVQVSQEYDVPLWNFWAAIQDLPRQGLQKDGAHLTWYPNDFSDPSGLEEASWPRRNLTALQVLEKVWQGVE